MALLKWKNHQIEDVEVDLLLQALKQRYGYDFSGYARASLKRRLRSLAADFEIPRLSELVPALLYNEELAGSVINSITVPTSDFFRDPEVWSLLSQQLLSQLSSFPWINIWQVGCGLGEEAYSLSILMHEAGLAGRMRIFSSDINTEFLRLAAQGGWLQHRFERWQKNYQQAGGRQDFSRYFEFHANRVTIKPEFTRGIAFVEHNLVADEVFKEVQWVLCRNVLIYFNRPLQQRVVALLARSLERGGYLQLGCSETLDDGLLHANGLTLLPMAGALYGKQR